MSEHVEVFNVIAEQANFLWTIHYYQYSSISFHVSLPSVQYITSEDSLTAGC